MRSRILTIGLLLAGLLFNAKSVWSQKQAIGVRLGNPVGITYKRDLSKSRALEFLIGTSSSGWSSNYYKNSFSAHKRYDDFVYRSHRISGTAYFQGRYLFQYNIPIEGMEGTLDWYWGIGAMLKVATLDYVYANPEVPQATINDRYTDIDLGPEGMAGMEYTFQDIPLELFGEVSLLVEFADRPLTLRTFGAVGARLQF